MFFGLGCVSVLFTFWIGVLVGEKIGSDPSREKKA
jgi:hypothetical protein